MIIRKYGLHLKNCIDLNPEVRYVRAYFAKTIKFTIQKPSLLCTTETSILRLGLLVKNNIFSAWVYGGSCTSSTAEILNNKLIK